MEISNFLQSLPSPHRHGIVLSNDRIHHQFARCRETKPCAYSLVRTCFGPLRSKHACLHTFRLGFLHPLGPLLSSITPGRTLYIKDGTPVRQKSSGLATLNSTDF